MDTVAEIAHVLDGRAKFPTLRVEIGDDSLSAAVEPGRHTFIKGRDLRNSNRLVRRRKSF